MITINTISEKHFSLNGINFAKIYQPLKRGSEGIGIFNIYDLRQQIMSTENFQNLSIDGETYSSQNEAIAAILDVVYSSLGAGEVQIYIEGKTDKGGYFGTSKDLDNRISNVEQNQVTGVNTFLTYADLPETGEDLVSYKVTNDPNSSLNGFYTWNGSVYVLNDFLVENKVEESNNTKGVSGLAVSLHTETAAISYLRQLNPDFIFQGFIDASENTPSPTLNHAWFPVEDANIFSKNLTRGQVIVGNGVSFDVYDFDIQEQFRLGLEFYPSSGRVSFPETNEIVFSNTTYLYSKIQGKYIRLVSENFPVSFEMGDGEFLVFDPTKTFSQVTDGHNYTVEDSIYKVSLNNFNPKKQISLLYHTNSVGITAGMGLISSYYHQQKNSERLLNLENFYKNLEFAVSNNVSFISKKTISFDGQTTIFSQLNGKYFRIKAEDDNYPVSFEMGDGEMLVFVPDFTKSHVGDGVNYIIQDSFQKVSQSSYDPKKQVPILFYTDSVGFHSNVGLLGSNYLFRLFKKEVSQIESKISKDVFSTEVEQSIEWVGDRLFILEGGETDHSDYATIKVVDKNGVTTGTTYSHNLGHANNFSYLENIDTAILGNHDGNRLTLAKITLISGVANPSGGILEHDDAIDIVLNDGISGLEGDLTATQCDVCWYDSSGDFVILGWYSYAGSFSAGQMRFAKAKLGKGTEDLSILPRGYGVYSAASGEYNGTLQLVQLYENDTLETFVEEGVGEFDVVVQDMCFYNGRLYLGIGRSDSVVLVLLLNEDNSNKGYNSTFKKVGVLSNGRGGEAEGVCVKDGVLYAGFTDSGVNVFSLNGFDSGSGKIGETIPFKFKNRGLPKLNISPIKNGALIATDLYVDEVTEEDFVVKSVLHGSSGDYLFNWSCQIN